VPQVSPAAEVTASSNSRHELIVSIVRERYPETGDVVSCRARDLTLGVVERSQFVDRRTADAGTGG
jgi:hypothetical protein